MKEAYEILHITYGDMCGDPYYGKERNSDSYGIVCAEESEIEAFVEELNKLNHSYYGKDEPEDEWDEDYVDQDYYMYKRVEYLTIDDVKKKHYLFRDRG